MLRVKVERLFCYGVLIAAFLCLEARGYDANLILNSLPEYKQQDFLSRKWTTRDTTLRVVQEEGWRAVSLLALIAAGRVIKASAPKGAAAAVTFCAQTVMDYALSSSMANFFFRAGSSLANNVIPGNPDALWRQGVAFSLGHSELLKHYWPDIQGQLQSRHDGVRSIRFMSPSLDTLLALNLVVPEDDADARAWLTMRVNHSRALPAQEKGLTGAWIALVSACRSCGVVSIRLRPYGHDAMIVQLWRDNHILSESRLAVSSDAKGSKLWLTDCLARKRWTRMNIGLINPLTAPVLAAITALVVEGETETVVSMNPLPALVSPKGQLAMFPTGTNGYLLVDRNKAVDVELPELWLNTDQPFDDGMEEALARLEKRQIPDHWRGIQGLGLEVGRSYITSSLIYAGLNWFPKDKNKVLLLPSPEWEKRMGVKILNPDGWDRSNYVADFNRPISRKDFNIKAAMSTIDAPPEHVHHLMYEYLQSHDGFVAPEK